MLIFPCHFFAPYTFTVRHILGCFRLCLQRDTNVPTRNCYPVWGGKSRQSPLLLIYFSDSLNGCSHCPKVWHKTGLICDAPFSRWAMRSFTPSQKSRRNHQIRYDFRERAEAIRYCTNIRRQQQVEQAKSNNYKFQAK